MNELAHVIDVQVIMQSGEQRGRTFVVKGEEAVLTYDNDRLEELCGCCVGAVELTKDGCSKLTGMGVKTIFFHCGNEMEEGLEEESGIAYITHGDPPEWFTELQKNPQEIKRLRGRPE